MYETEKGQVLTFGEEYGLIFGKLVSGFMLSFFMALITQALWNGSVSQTLHLPELNYWQVWCIVYLRNLLFPFGKSYVLKEYRDKK